MIDTIKFEIYTQEQAMELNETQIVALEKELTHLKRNQELRNIAIEILYNELDILENSDSETFKNQLLELIGMLQSDDVSNESKVICRQKLIDLVTCDYNNNWQTVGTPIDIATEMIELIPSDVEKFIVFFSLEFLEVLVKNKGVNPKNILFIADTETEELIAKLQIVYGVNTCIMSKKENFQNNKLIFPNLIFNFLNEVNTMKFNNTKTAIVMNPPYNDGKMNSIYPKFIEGAIDDLNADYLLSINPSKWMTGGKGMNKFREKMINIEGVKNIVHFGGYYDIFPTVKLSGGVNYFLYEKGYNGKCEFVDGNTNVRSDRKLNDYDVVIQDNNAISILDKVMNNSSDTISNVCLAQKPFNLRSNFIGNDNEVGVKCYRKDKKEILTTYCEEGAYVDKFGIKDKYKVCISKTNDDSQLNVAHRITTKPTIFEPNSINTETFLVLNSFNTRKEAENFASYVETKFFRFMTSLRKCSHNISKDVFAFVPDLGDYSASWTDTDLFDMFNLNKAERTYIKAQIKAM